MRSENKTAESLEENETKENQQFDEFRKQLITKSSFLVSFRHIKNPLLTTLARSGLLDMSSPFFFSFGVVYGLRP